MSSRKTKKQIISEDKRYSKKYTLEQLLPLKSLTNNQALQYMLLKYGLTMTKAGLIYWNRKYSLGKKVLGRWLVNKERLDQLLKSREDVISGNL